MTKHRRYQLTEKQLLPVIQYINEDYSNYPAGVTDYNIDRLSGADRDVHGQVRDVTLDPNGNLIFDIRTEQGQTVEKEVWLGDDVVISAIEPLLPRFGYDLKRFPEWEVTNASMQGNNVVLDITGDGRVHQVIVDNGIVMAWLPELTDNDLEPSELDEDPLRERGGW